VDRAPLRDPLVLGRTARHPLLAPVLGHSDYQADPAFAQERRWLLDRLRPGVPAPRPEDEAAAAAGPGAPAQDSSGRSAG
jgi:hypothetical protein